jgi:hypothetical protein
MNTGMYILCNKKFGQFLLTENPYCIINGESRWLGWGMYIYVPLQPNVQYYFSIQFPYIGRACGIASMVITLREGEIHYYEYQTPFIVYSPGSLYRIG